MNSKRNWEKEKDLFGGQGAVAVEIIHEGEGVVVVVVQCRGLLFFVFDVHSYHNLHFLEGSVHFFHRFLEKMEEKTVDLWRIIVKTQRVSIKLLQISENCYGISIGTSQRPYFTLTKLILSSSLFIFLKYFFFVCNFASGRYINQADYSKKKPDP